MQSHPPDPALRIAWTTVASAEDAERIATQIITQKLAACIQIDGPIRSVYSWQGNIHSDQEFRLWFKFLPHFEHSLFSAIRQIHPYSVPQWISVNATSVSPDYLDWVIKGSNAKF